MSEILKNYWELEQELSKDNSLVREIFPEITKELSEKYSISRDTILNITKNELEEIKNNIKTSNQKWILKSYIKSSIYEEYIETKLEQPNWIKEITVDKITENITSQKIIESKKVLNDYVENFTKNYDFLWENEKEIFKLAISNKIIDSFSPIEMLNLSKILWSVMNWIKSLDFWKVKEETSKISNEFKEIKKKLEQILTPYKKLFSKVQNDLNKWNYTNKINIISNIEWFHNPINIENYSWEELDFDYEKFKNSNEYNTSIKNPELIAKYLIRSKIKIEKLDQQMKNWSKYKQMALSLISNEQFWKHIEIWLQWLLKIPFIWKLIAIFLWLDPEKPFESLLEEKDTFKTYKEIKNFWWIKKEDWTISKNADSKVKILSDKDLSELDYERLQPSLKDINKILNTWKKDNKKDNNTVLSQIFTKNWYNWLSIKLNEDCFDNKKPNKNFYDIFEKSIIEFKNNKDQSKIEKEKIQLEEKVEKLKKEKESLEKDTKLWTIEWVLTDVDNWLDKNIDRNIYKNRTETEEYKTKKQKLQKVTAELNELQSKQKLYKLLQKINWDLSEWINLSEWDTNISIKQNWSIITINNVKYSITAYKKFIWNAIVQNTIINWDKVILKTDIWEANFTKGEIIEALYTTINSWSFKKDDNWSYLKIDKVS